MRLRIGLLAAMASLITGGAVQAGKFNLTNRSGKPVYVAIVHHVPASDGGHMGDMSLPGQSEHWRSVGWLRIESGQTKALYEGNEKHIFIRMTIGSGPPLRPRAFYSEKKFHVFDKAWETRTFETNRRTSIIGKVDGRPIGNAGSWGEIPGARLADGFFELDSATNFTVP